ncbi:unnamed protein product [Ostreobium quekettii]|uniref:Uncharacterized protein n=1 Tax=Ostreobium quekettii TaxID=121088 RepID=A0A8S1ITG8_9CHLO|nr:unnamed protein product [Ostreobium quekettii]
MPMSAGCTTTRRLGDAASSSVQIEGLWWELRATACKWGCTIVVPPPWGLFEVRADSFGGVCFGRVAVKRTASFRQDNLREENWADVADFCALMAETILVLLPLSELTEKKECQCAS